jgi:hypothetical protein
LKWQEKRSILYSDFDVFCGRRRMKLADFEQRVWEVEGIRIVIRGDENDEVKDYSFKNAAIENWNTTAFLKNRIEPRVGGRKVVVIRGDGEMPNGRVLLRNLRASYSAK